MANFRMREAKHSDLKEVVPLLHGLGLELDSSPDEILKKWDLYSLNNPAQKNQHHPFGWVLEDGDRLVGFFGSIPRMYRLGDELVRVAVASTWAVVKEYREGVSGLCEAYFGQANVDLLLVTTASRATTRIFDRFEGGPLPDPNYNRVLFWIVDSRGFIHSTLEKLKIHRAISSAIGTIGAPFFKLADFVLRRVCGIGNAGLEMVSRCSPAEIGPEFDGLWQRKLKQAQVLMAYRDCESLRWSTKLMAIQNDVTIFCYRDGDDLRGYLILLKECTENISLTRGKVVDLFVENDDPEIVDALFRSAFIHAKQERCQLFELVGFSSPLKKRLQAYRPLSRTFPTFPFHYVANSLELRSKLQDIDNWYPSLFDGDSSFY